MGGHSVDHHVNKLTGYYNDEKWKTFFDGDNIDTVAKGTWCTNKDAEPQVAGGRRYGAAKICAVMMVAELQRRLDTDSALKNISVVGIDPGSMSTDIVRHGDWFTRTIFFPFIIAFVAQLMTLLQPNPMFRTTAKSANDLIAAAFEVGPRLRGKYLDGTELVDTSREAADVKKRELVWRDSVRYTQLTDRDTMLARWS
jgi:NAD(P)-dependent dehydrogenase (short-subunit alcohol dehydrogenase family)